MADAPAPVRIPARRQYRVQLRFVTEEQLFAAGPLSLPNPKSLRLEVHPAGEEADATVTDGEVYWRDPRARVALGSGGPWRARGRGVRGAVLVALSRCAPPPHDSSPGGSAGLPRLR